MPYTPISTGVLPGPGPNLDEANYITRRGITPHYFVQIYNTTPMIALLMRASKRASGGIAQYNAPFQFMPLTQGVWMGYTGTFNIPNAQVGTLMGQWNLKLFGVPIPYYYAEALYQDQMAYVDILEARCNDAVNITRTQLSISLYNNISNNQALIGLPAAVDNGTDNPNGTYAGLSYNQQTPVDPVTGAPGYPLRAYVINENNATPTRITCFMTVAGMNKYSGMKPNVAVSGPATWATLGQDFITHENFYVEPGQGFDTDQTHPRSAFDAYQIAGVYHIADPFCPEGRIYYLNTDFIYFVFHEKVFFVFTGFYSLVPTGALQWVGVYLTMLELVNVMPRAQGKALNYAYTAI